MGAISAGTASSTTVAAGCESRKTGFSGYIAPNPIPAMVAMTIVRTTNTAVFLLPTTERITKMLGNDRAGPAKSSAKAGPDAIPFFINASRIGTSVKVAK